MHGVDKNENLYILGGSMDKVQKSLKRIEGQVRGVSRLYSEKKSCLSVVQQIVAAKAALERVGRDLLKEEACECMVGKDNKKLEKILKQLFKS